MDITKALLRRSPIVLVCFSFALHAAPEKVVHKSLVEAQIAQGAPSSEPAQAQAKLKSKRAVSCRNCELVEATSLLRATMTGVAAPHSPN